MLRNTLLTNNLSNVDTPGYQPEDVNFQSDASAAPCRPASRRRASASSLTPSSIDRCGRQRGRPPSSSRPSSPERPALRDLDPDRRPSTRHPRKRDGHRTVLTMGLFDAIGIAGSGLSAQRMRMDVTAENLANADTTKGANGQPYQRQEVELAADRLARLPAARSPSALGARQPPGPRRRRRAGRGDRQRHDARPAGLRPGQPRSQRAGLREDAERQHRSPK